MKVDVKSVKRYINKSKSVIKYIKEEREELKNYWLSNGLTENEIDTLIQMEIEEDMKSFFYLSRKSLLELGKISIEQIKEDINKKLNGEFCNEGRKFNSRQYL